MKESTLSLVVTIGCFGIFMLELLQYVGISGVLDLGGALFSLFSGILFLVLYQREKEDERRN